MATEHDPIKALKEIITGLSEVYKLIFHRCQQAERRYVEAEQEFNELTKLMHFVNGQLEEARSKLRKLTDANK